MAHDEMEDIELQPLAQNDTTNSSPSTPRSSSDSAASRLLTDVNAAGQNSPSYTDFEEEPRFMALRPGKKFKRGIVVGVIALAAIIYTAWLLSYRAGNHRSRRPELKNATEVVSTSSLSDTATVPFASTTEDPLNDLLSSLMSQVSSSTPTTTKELVQLTELPVRPEREEIPKLNYRGALLKDVPSFIGSSSTSKSEDQGFYVIKEGERFLLKSLADTQFLQQLYPGGGFDFNGQRLSVSVLAPNGDASKAIAFSGSSAVFRHSQITDAFLLDIETQKFTPITSSDSTSKLSHVQWSKTFKYISFVQDADLYILDTTTGTITRVTNDGSENISNARTDWVYEEEVLTTDSALWWDHDDSKFMFLKFNETGVDEIMLELYDEGIYPTISKIKYPKPGRKNPEVSLWKYDVTGNQLDQVDRSDSQAGDEWVCYGGMWIDGSFVIRETDRESKKLDYRLIKDGVSKIVSSIDSNEYDGWIENFNEMVPIPKNETAKRTNDGFVDIIQFENFNHIGFYESLESTTPTMLTSGDWEVISIDFFDKEQNLLYFTSNRQSHFEQHLFAVDISTKQMYSISEINEQGFHDTGFSPGGKFIFDYNVGPTFPTLLLYDTTEVAEEKNENNEKRSIDFLGTRRSYHTVTLSDGETVDVIEMVPERFDKTKPHPLLVNIYGGPGYRKLNVQLHAGFEDSISDDLNAVILYVDPRGTGGQGWKYRSYAKRHIGHWEPRDITEVTKLWIDSRDYIDEERVSIWGWSYGGFTTLKTLEYDGGNVFKYGMAVAPVTDWRMYDSIYTERYMDQPKDNEDGYKESKIANVDNLKGVKRFAIMHGTGDDNVHIQNTFKLLDDLNLHGVTNFDLMVYPDSNHNINYHNAYGVLMSRLRDWMKDHVL